ncbi:hypothetical protein [Parafrigoribacterium soli]|uniref:hypothetical protein n=1 Tax=Parafrigoribacterium soli TaxID=3144663 RepID=UPI0032EF99E9
MTESSNTHRADDALSPVNSATGAPTAADTRTDGNPYEHGPGDPTGGATPQSTNRDSGRPDGNPEALVQGQRVTTQHDMESSGDPSGLGTDDAAAAEPPSPHAPRHKAEPEDGGIIDDIAGAVPGRLDEDPHTGERDPDLEPDAGVGLP